MSNEHRAHTVERESYEYLKWPSDEFIIPLLKEKIDFVLSGFASSPKNGARVLDIGCGGQPYRKHLEEMGYDYIGLDVANNPAGTVDFIAEIDKQLPDDLAQAPKFDLIFCTEVMEHVADWDGAFKNFDLLLAPGGKVIITCPFFFMLHEEPFDFWRPTLNALMYFANKVGFTTIYNEKAGTGWDIIGTLLLAVNPKVKLQNNNILKRFRNKLIQILFKGQIVFVLWILKKRIIQKYLELKGEIYLSNIIAFEK